MPGINAQAGFAMLGLVGGLLVATPASAFSAEHVLRPHTDRIDACTAGLHEVARQADFRQAELEAWLAHSRGLRDEMQRNAARLEEHHEMLRTRDSRALAVAPSLMPEGTDRAHVPHYSVGVFGYFQQRRDQTNAAIAEASGRFRDGEAQFRIHGRGMMTGSTLDARIAQDEEAIATHRASVDAGEFRITHPALGNVTRGTLEDCIARERDQIAQTTETIARGEYRVTLPHLGAVTRNRVEEMIATAEAELAAVEAQQRAGALRITRNRAAVTGEQVTQRLTANDNDRAALETAVASGAFIHRFPTMESRSIAQLDERIGWVEARIADVRAAEAEGSYAVALAGSPSAINAAQARERLALPGCRPQGPTPCITDEARAAVQDALRRIPVAVAFDIEFWTLELRRNQAWRAAFASHARPEFDRLDVERRLLEVLDAEFGIELGLHRDHIRQRIDWLRANLEFIP